jgi:DNA-binding MarR family transcriptional regulator
METSIMELIARAHLTWKRRIARDLAPFGTNPKQLFVLRKLRETGGCLPSRIAELIYADRPTASSMIGTLERAGWARRRRDPANGKQVLVEITPKGRKQLQAVPENLWRTGKTRCNPEACLTAAERDELIRLLSKLNGWLKSAG